MAEYEKHIQIWPEYLMTDFFTTLRKKINN